MGPAQAQAQSFSCYTLVFLNTYRPDAVIKYERDVTREYFKERSTIQRSEKLMSDVFGINAMDEYIRSRCLTFSDSFSFERITSRNPIFHHLTALSPEEITNDHALCNEKCILSSQVRWLISSSALSTDIKIKPPRKNTVECSELTKYLK